MHSERALPTFREDKKPLIPDSRSRAAQEDSDDSRQATPMMLTIPKQVSSRGGRNAASRMRLLQRYFGHNESKIWFGKPVMLLADRLKFSEMSASSFTRLDPIYAEAGHPP